MHMLFHSGICVPAIGASGAIMGLMGGFMLLYPATRIVTVVLLWRFPVGIQRIAALYILASYFILDLINGIASLGPETAATSGVAFWAHVGGFLAGFVLSFFIMTFKPLPPVDPFAYMDED
jgi:membrane associated rhomboid family serine protease